MLYYTNETVFRDFRITVKASNFGPYVDFGLSYPKELAVIWMRPTEKLRKLKL